MVLLHLESFREHRAHAAARIDESTLPAIYPEAGITGVHPLAWKQKYMGGRSFYTALCHTGASCQDELFVRAIALGAEWAGGTAG